MVPKSRNINIFIDRVYFVVQNHKLNFCENINLYDNFSRQKEIISCEIWIPRDFVMIYLCGKIVKIKTRARFFLETISLSIYIYIYIYFPSPRLGTAFLSFSRGLVDRAKVNEWTAVFFFSREYAHLGAKLVVSSVCSLRNLQMGVSAL